MRSDGDFWRHLGAYIQLPVSAASQAVKEARMFQLTIGLFATASRGMDGSSKSGGVEVSLLLGGNLRGYARRRAKEAVWTAGRIVMGIVVKISDAAAC